MKNLIVLFLISISICSFAQNDVTEVHQGFYSLYTDNLTILSKTGDTLLLNASLDNDGKLYLNFENTNFNDSLMTIITDVVYRT